MDRDPTFKNVNFTAGGKVWNVWPEILQMLVCVDMCAPEVESVVVDIKTLYPTLPPYPVVEICGITIALCEGILPMTTPE